MSERSEQIRKTLESIGVDPVTTSDVSKQIARREELLKAHPLAYEYAHEVRERYAERQSLTFDEAVEVYRKVPELQMLGARKRVIGTDKDARDSLIVMYLLILHQCGLPVTSHADDRSMKSSRTTLPSDERVPCLACLPVGLQYRAGRRARRRRTADGGARTGRDARSRCRPRPP